MQNQEYNGVTIMVPCFNAGELLEACLSSVQAQAHLIETAFEVIVVDDGSTDPTTVDILNSALDKYQRIPNLRVLRQQNMGQSVARNTAMRAAHFPLVMNLDADDKMDTSWITDQGMPSYLDAAVNAYNTNPDLLFYHCPARFFDEADTIGALPEKPDLSLAYSCSIRPHSIFRLNECLAIGGYPEDLRQSEDAVMFRRMLSKRLSDKTPYDIQANPYPYYRYRVHQKTDRVSNSRKVSALQIHWRLLRDCRPLLALSLKNQPIKTIAAFALYTAMHDLAPSKGYWTRIRTFCATRGKGYTAHHKPQPPM